MSVLHSNHLTYVSFLCSYFVDSHFSPLSLCDEERLRSLIGVFVRDLFIAFWFLLKFLCCLPRF